MKFKRLLITISLLMCVCVPASATLASLDDALSPLLSGKGAVSLSASLTLETLQPFDQTRIDLFNRVLSYARLNARIDLASDVQTTEVALLLGAHTLFTLSEQNRGGAYLLQTSLLPNRRVLSTQASPDGFTGGVLPRRSRSRRRSPRGSTPLRWTARLTCWPPCGNCKLATAIWRIRSSR